MIRRVRAFATVALLSGTLALVAQAADAARAPGAPIIELPSLTVTDTRALPKPEQWRYARLGGFEVLCNGSEANANRVLRSFQKFHRALQLLQPVALKPMTSASIILTGEARKFDDFTPTGKRDYSGVVSLFLRDREQMAIVVDLETRNVQTDDITMTKADGSFYKQLEIEHDRQLAREYVRFLLSQTEAALPPWFLEGVVQMVMDIQFFDRTIKYGWIDSRSGGPVHVGTLYPAESGMRAGNMIALMAAEGSPDVDDPTTTVGDRPFNMVLAHRPLLPLDKFFAVTADSPAARNPLGNSLWAKQAYAFVHMCQLRADKRLQQPFATFVRRLANEPPSEALFKECFNMSYREMLDELYQYFRRGQYLYRTLKLTEEGRLTAVDVEFRNATQAEIGRIKGDAQRLAGRRSEALATYRTAYARRENDPRLLVGLGIEEGFAGETKRARELLEAAAKLNVDRPLGYVELARLRLEEANKQPGAEGHLSAAQVAAVLAPLLKARALKPALPETYTIMAETWARSVVPPTVENIHLIGEGVVQFPEQSELTYRTARLYAQAGDVKNATELARLGLRFARDGAMRARFEQLLAGQPAAR